jgi:hypothetical protein
LLYFTSVKRLQQLIKEKVYLCFLFAFFVGILVGMSLLSLLVPDATKFIKLYKEQKSLVSDIRNGKETVTADLWLENAKSMRAKSDNEFISDLININGTVILMNNRLQLGMYLSNEKLKAFGERVAEQRKNELVELKLLEQTLTN